MPNDNELQTEIRSILWDMWDPIGLKSTDAPVDEYDEYVEQICRIVINENQINSIIEYLKMIEESNMGLKFNLNRARIVAHAIADVGA